MRTQYFFALKKFPSCSRTIRHEGCKIWPSYGGRDGKAKYCAEHSRPGDKNVKSRLCTQEGCESHATYGDPKGAAMRCLQ